MSASLAGAAWANRGWKRPRLSLTAVFSWFFALLTAGVIVWITLLFVTQSLPVWRHSGLDYLTGIRWFHRALEFGALPMIYGTAAVSLVALFTAAPMGIGAAIFTSEFLPGRWRMTVKMAIELLAGIPSVVYGLLGVLFLRNWVYEWLKPFDPLSGDTLLTAGLLLGVMVLPTVMTLSDDALRGVPALQRHAARGLGLTRTEAIFSVVIPQALPGLTGAVLLALGRALGETIAVFLVVGRQDNQWPQQLLSLQPLMEAGQTLTSKLGGSETNIAYGDPLHWAAITGLGFILLGIVAAVTITGVWLEKLRD
jgi:phosphate transport system permease protein